MKPKNAPSSGSDLLLPRDPRVCCGKGLGWEAVCSPWELPLILWVPFTSLLLALQGAEERSVFLLSLSLYGKPCVTLRNRAGWQEGLCRSQTVGTVVQARPSCSKIRAGAEQEGTCECVRDGKALPCSPGRVAGSGWCSKQEGLLETPWAGRIT